MMTPDNNLTTIYIPSLGMFLLGSRGLGKVVTPFKEWYLDYLVRRGLEAQGYVEG